MHFSEAWAKSACFEHFWKGAGFLSFAPDTASLVAKFLWFWSTSLSVSEEMSVSAVMMDFILLNIAVWFLLFCYCWNLDYLNLTVHLFFCHFMFCISGECKCTYWRGSRSMNRFTLFLCACATLAHLKAPAFQMNTVTSVLISGVIILGVMSACFFIFSLTLLKGKSAPVSTLSAAHNPAFSWAQCHCRHSLATTMLIEWKTADVCACRESKLSVDLGC